MTSLAILFAILTLAPVAFYLTGLIRDPFHPLILIGTLSYFISGHRMFTEKSQLLNVMPEDCYSAYLIVSIISVAGIYIGWWWAGRAQRKAAGIQKPPDTYDTGQLMVAATVCAAIAVFVHFGFYEDYDLSGYLLDIKMLWVTAAILCVQCFVIDPRTRVWGIVVFITAVAVPVERFLNYGQRGDTFRLAAVAEGVYLTLRRRPSKPVFLTAAVVLALVLGTLQLTRNIVLDGEASNRFTALASVIPRFLRETGGDVDPGEEVIFGPAVVQTARDSGRFGYGLHFTAGLIIHLLPRGLFPNKDFLLPPTAGLEASSIMNSTGLTISGGAAPSGFASGFAEMGWFCPLPWILLAYFYRRFWDKMAVTSDILFQGLFLGYTMAVLYAISQDIVTAEVNFLYCLLPMALIYHFARTRNPEPAPKLAAQ